MKQQLRDAISNGGKTLPYACVFLFLDGRIVVDGREIVDILVSGLSCEGRPFEQVGHVGRAMLFVETDESGVMPLLPHIMELLQRQMPFEFYSWGRQAAPDDYLLLTVVPGEGDGSYAPGVVGPWT